MRPAALLIPRRRCRCWPTPPTTPSFLPLRAELPERFREWPRRRDPKTRGVFPREDQRLGERQRLDRLGPAGGSGRSRRCCRLLRESCGRTRDCGCKEPPTPFVLVVHIWILQQRFSHGSLKPARPRARMPPRSAAADLGTLANSLLLVGRSARAPAFTPRTPQIMTERTAIIIPRMNLRLRRLFITVAGELSVRRAATLVHSSLNGITKSRRSRRRLPPNRSEERRVGK